MPAISLSLKCDDAAGELERRHGAPELVGFAGVKPAHSMATRIACSWNSGTPRVLPSTFSSSGLG